VEQADHSFGIGQMKLFDLLDPIEQLIVLRQIKALVESKNKERS